MLKGLVQKAQTLSLDAVSAGNLRDASERALARELKEAGKAPRFDDRERLREQAQQAHEIRMRHVDDLAADFVALGQKEDISPILQEMLRILNEETIDSVDKAIAYADRLRPALLEGVQACAACSGVQERNRNEPGTRS